MSIKCKGWIGFASRSTDEYPQCPLVCDEGHKAEIYEYMHKDISELLFEYCRSFHKHFPRSLPKFLSQDDDLERMSLVFCYCRRQGHNVLQLPLDGLILVISDNIS